MMKKRYDFMDVIRFLSMAGIVYYHLLATLYLCGIRQYESISPFFENNNIHVATVGVGLFFMISGAGLMLSTKDKEHLNLKEYYKKRFFRVLVPFYVVYVLDLIAILLLSNEGIESIFNQNPSPFAFIFTLFGMDAYISSFGVATFSLGIGEWFLGALIMMYIIFPFLRWALLKNKWISLLVATVYYIIVLVTYQYMPYADRVPGFTNFTCKVYEFFLGMFFILVIEKIPKWIAAVAAPVIIFFLVYPAKLPLDKNLSILIANVAFFMLFVGLEKFFNKIPSVIKAISFLCGFSYEFFLVHHVIIQYMTLQHIGVPFGNKDVLILFAQEIGVIIIFTILVKGILSLPKAIKSRKASKTGSNC